MLVKLIYLSIRCMFTNNISRYHGKHGLSPWYKMVYTTVPESEMTTFELLTHHQWNNHFISTDSWESSYSLGLNDSSCPSLGLNDSSRPSLGLNNSSRPSLGLNDSSHPSLGLNDSNLHSLGLNEYNHPSLLLATIQVPRPHGHQATIQVPRLHGHQATIEVPTVLHTCPTRGAHSMHTGGRVQGLRTHTTSHITKAQHSLTIATIHRNRTLQQREIFQQISANGS